MTMNKFKLTISIFTILALLTTGINNVSAGEATGTIGNGGEGAVGTPDVPTGLTASAASTSQIEVSWSAVSGVTG